MTEIVNTNVRKLGKFSDSAPWFLHICKMLPFNVAGNHIRIIFSMWNGFEQLHSHRS